jgi:muconate cycloisomerase
MRIKTLRLYENRQPFKFSFDSPQTRRRRAEAVILVLEFDNGVISFGESTPRDYVTGETCASVIAAIGHFFAPILLGARIANRQDVVKVLNRLPACCPRLSPSALGAVDLALWDGLARMFRQPVFYLFSDSPRPLPPYSISIPYLPLSTIQDLYQRFQSLAIERVKVLLTGDRKQDLERIRFIRDLVGKKTVVSLEANGKLDLFDVMAVLERLGPGEVRDIEQPAARTDIEGLRSIRRRFGLPVVVDESLCSLSDAQYLVDAGACDILNVKISKCGGLLRAREIIAWAASRNICCHLGSHIGETEILSNAAQHLALSTENLSWMEIGSFILTNGIESQAAAELHKRQSSPMVGLGVFFDSRMLARRFGPAIAEFSAL